MKLTAREWEALVRVGRSAAWVALSLEISIDEAEARMAEAQSRIDGRRFAASHPAAPKLMTPILSRADRQRSGWRSRLPA